MVFFYEDVWLCDWEMESIGMGRSDLFVSSFLLIFGQDYTVSSDAEGGKY